MSVIGSGKRVVVEHHGRNAGFLKNFDAFVVVGVLALVDQQEIGLERNDLFRVENVVVVAADARDFLDLRKRLRQRSVFAKTRGLPAVLRQGDDFFQTLGSAHHQKVKDVVSHDDALRRLFERDRAILEIGDGYGGGSCTQRQHAEKQNKGSGLKKTTEHIRNLKEDGTRLPLV